jgi:GLE1-like protein
VWECECECVCQVAKKADAFVGLVSRNEGAQATYAMIQLATKLVSQCEAQVLRLHSFAFPLAEVAVAVAARFPVFMDLLVAKLQQVVLRVSQLVVFCAWPRLTYFRCLCGVCVEACILAVPKYPVKQGESEAEHLGSLGFRERGQEGNAGSLESEDDYVARLQVRSNVAWYSRPWALLQESFAVGFWHVLEGKFGCGDQGYIRFLAAILQSEGLGNPVGLVHAWAYLSRYVPCHPMRWAVFDAKGLDLVPPALPLVQVFELLACESGDVNGY